MDIRCLIRVLKLIPDIIKVSRITPHVHGNPLPEFKNTRECAQTALLPRAIMITRLRLTRQDFRMTAPPRRPMPRDTSQL